MADNENNNSNDNSDSKTKTLGDKVKGVIQGTKNYSIVLNDRSSAVNIVDNVANKWLIRVDNAHKNVPYEHININPKITGIPDPHTAIPSSALQAAENTAWAFKQANKILLPAAVAIDAARIGTSAYKDYQHGTARNTVTTVSSIGGAWGGGLAGAEAGAAIGSMILPGIGTLAGAVIGGISGGIGGAAAAEKITDVVADTAELGIEWLECRYCKCRFECRIYTGQNSVLCPECIRKVQEGEIIVEESEEGDE